MSEGEGTAPAPSDEAVVRRVLCKTLTPCPHHEDQARAILAAIDMPRREAEARAEERAATLREVVKLREALDAAEAMASGILHIRTRDDRTSWDEVEISRANFLAVLPAVRYALAEAAHFNPEAEA